MPSPKDRGRVREDRYRLEKTVKNYLLLAVAGLLATVTGGSSRAPQAPAYEVVVTKDVMIPTRDGVRLATDLYRPAHNGVAVPDRLPVLLHRTPYGKAGMQHDADYFARHGYVVAVQDIRGRHESEGKFEKYDDRGASDGFDVIQWLARQDYSNGMVGMWGTSYAAHTQADAAKLNPPALRTIVVNMGGMSNAWDHSVRFRGAFEMGRQLTWAWQQADEDAASPLVKAALARDKVTDWYAAQPFQKGLNPLSVAPEYEAYYLDEQNNANYGPYWKRIGMNWDEYYGQTSDIPMIHVGGWYDIYTAGTFENYVNLRRLKRPSQRVLVGPWTHHGNTRPYAGDVSFGPSAAIADFDGEWHLRWFDHFLKGRANGVERDAPVRLFVMGTGDGHKDENGRLFHGGYWRDAQQWPLAGTRFVPYYLHADGSLAPNKASDSASSATYTFDPHHPVPSIGGGISARLGDGGYDQREDPRFPPSRPPYLPLKSRSDILVFQTEPLARDVEVIGPIVVHLYASSSAYDTDFTAKLIDVYPPSTDYPQGFDLNLTDAIVRARYRASRDHAELLVPGKVYRFDIEPFPTANVFKAGHRIRVDISSSNFPRFDVNPNTGEPLGRSRRAIPADNTVYYSVKYPSQIVVPIVPREP
jgi:putative CocE/NonD family hydrolase